MIDSPSIAVLAAVLTATSLASQDQAALIAKRDAKLKKEWIQNAAWITDYDAVRAKARESGKPIFGYFTRSYSP